MNMHTRQHLFARHALVAAALGLAALAAACTGLRQQLPEDATRQHHTMAMDSPVCGFYLRIFAFNRDLARVYTGTHRQI